MFGREFTGKGHRQHVLPPNPTSYAFERVGNRKVASWSDLGGGAWSYDFPGGPTIDISRTSWSSSDGGSGAEPTYEGNLWEARKHLLREGYDEEDVRDFTKAPFAGGPMDNALGPSQPWASRKQANAFDELMDFLGDSFSGQPSVADVKEYLQFEKDYPSSNGASVSNLAEELENYFGYDLSEFRTGSRRTASGWKEEYDGTWYIRLPGDVVGFLSPSDDPEVSGTYRASAEVDRPDDSRMLLNVFGVSLEEGKRLVEQAAAQVSASRTASHHLAFFDGLDLPEPRHRVAGWDWDDHLNGFLAAEAAREFTCSCGANVPAPGYTDCRCGKRWNAYTIQTNGSQKMIAREVPVRDGVVMANRRTAAGTGWETPPVDLGTLSDEELREFVFNVQHAIDSGANIGTIMENKKSHFRDELVRRGWRVDGMGYPYKE